MYWDRYIHRDNPRRIEPLDKPLDMYVMLDTETTGLNPEEGAALIEIGAFLVQPGNENSRPKFEQLIDRANHCRNSSPGSPASPTKCSKACPQPAPLCSVSTNGSTGPGRQGSR